MLKDAGELGEIWVTDVTQSVVTDGKMGDWCKSSIVNVYDLSKGDAL